MTNPFDGTTAQWAYDQARAAGAGTDTMASNEHLFLPLKSPTRTRGVLAIRPERGRDLMIPEQRHQFDIFAALVATALERVHYVDVARDALLMARIQSRDLKLELHARSIVELAEGAMRSLGAAIAKHSVAIEIPRDLPMVAVDAKLMERVFVSLIGNVAKHTPAGTHATVSARLVGDFVEVSVADDGPGLPAGREEEIFESFARGDDAPSPKQGAGLGLAIVRAIVEAHGGSIHAERGPREGHARHLHAPAQARDRVAGVKAEQGGARRKRLEERGDSYFPNPSRVSVPNATFMDRMKFGSLRAPQGFSSAPLPVQLYSFPQAHSVSLPAAMIPGWKAQSPSSRKRP
jgi:K+-sensing histidine kinase KdpD